MAIPIAFLARRSDDEFGAHNPFIAWLGVAIILFLVGATVYGIVKPTHGSLGVLRQASLH